jgi:hypothetical protein
MNGSLTDPSELTVVARGHALRTPKTNGPLADPYELITASKTLAQGHALRTRK